MKPSDFRLDEYGEWRTTLPREKGTFYGRAIGVAISRLRINEREPRPASMELMAKILSGLPRILAVAEREFEREELESDPSFIEHITNPHIWISGEGTDPDAWTFVVERSDCPDYGCHIEFRDCNFCEIWAGD